jgi:hypothetical protein
MSIVLNTSQCEGSSHYIGIISQRSLQLWRTNKAITIYLLIFFFDKSKCIKKAQRGVAHSTQDVYKGKPKGRKISEKENLGN